MGKLIIITQKPLVNYILYLTVFIIVSNAQLVPDSIEKESFKNYGNKLTQKYRNKDYLAAIFGNPDVREDFTNFANSHLTPELKSDFKAVRIYKKVGGVEMPVINFSSDMDSWLGVLPQWKRVKAFWFREMESFVDTHPEILTNARPPSTSTSPLFFQKRDSTIK